MISPHERSDIVHIMKMNRFVLTESDSSYLEFTGRVGEKSYLVSVSMIEYQPQTIIKKDDSTVYNDTLNSVDDLKIFLEEKLYQFLEV